MDFSRLSNELPDGGLKKIYSIISSYYPNGVADAGGAPALSVSHVEEIRDIMRSEVESGVIADGGSFQTVEEVRKRAEVVVKDSFYNPVTGIGTGADPGYYNSASIPISISPNEATALYANGGLGQIIIDKKAKGVFANGYQFKASDWPREKLEELKQYANSLGLEKTITEAGTNGLIYGGALVVPTFEGDSPISYASTIKENIMDGVIKKGSLKRFWIADRWNCVLVPNYNISASDYIYPKSFYVPIAGLEVNSERMAVVRPKILPYWGTIRQMGWGVSDYTGYLHSLLNYEVAIASIPIMSQQLSLMYHHIPMDGLIAQNGAKYADQYAKLNEAQMRDWSNINPRTINSFGEIKTIQRNYAGFSELVSLLRQDIGAKSGIAESILFHTQSTGFSDNKEDVTLKQAETVGAFGQELAYQLKPIVKVLILSCFGPDSEEARKCDEVSIAFDSPTVVTNEEKISSLTAFASAVAQFYSTGMSAKDSVEMSRAFIDMEIPQELMDGLDDSPHDESENPDAVGGDIMGPKKKGGFMENLFGGKK